MGAGIADAVRALGEANPQVRPARVPLAADAVGAAGVGDGLVVAAPDHPEAREAHVHPAVWRGVVLRGGRDEADGRQGQGGGNPQGHGA